MVSTRIIFFCVTFKLYICKYALEKKITRRVFTPFFLQALTYALKIFNYFFTAVFILECVMKMLALGLQLYVKDKYVYALYSLTKAE